MRSSKPEAWLPLYIADYLADTTHLTTEQHGAYLLLLMAMWRAGGRLSSDDAQLAQIARLPMPAWRRVRPMLLPFFQADGATLTQKRLTEEYERAQRNNDAQRVNGSKGGRPKKNPTASPNETQTKPTGFDSLNPRGNPTETPSPSPTPEASTPTLDSNHTHTAPNGAGSVRVFEGGFEGGGDDPVEVGPRTPVVEAVVALRARGFEVTALHPGLNDALSEGVTVANLTEMADQPVCRGKAAGYVISACRRQRADLGSSPPASTGSRTAKPSATDAVNGKDFGVTRLHPDLQTAVARDPNRDLENVNF